MPVAIWHRLHEVEGHRQLFTHPDDEETWTRLGDVSSSINNERAESVPGPHKCSCDGREVLPPVRGERSNHVLEYNQLGCSIGGSQPLDQVPERPEGPAPFASEAVSWSGKGEILTGERGPSEVGYPREVIDAEALDVSIARP